MASPPKPWERAGAGGTSSSGKTVCGSLRSLGGDMSDANVVLTSTPAMSAGTTTMPSSTSTSSSNPPSLPQRPTALNSVVNQTASNYSSYNTANRPFGASP